MLHFRASDLHSTHGISCPQNLFAPPPSSSRRSARVTTAKMGYYDYIFILGVIFCVLDAMGCGANDVANSMATAVNAKSLSMTQAMMLATVMEILGALTLGSYNADTIRGGIISLTFFKDKGGSLMMGMLCAVMSSSLFNFLSNRFGWATSSTHAMIGALVGVGVSSGAGVTWGYIVSYDSKGNVSKQNGLGSVIASFFISPALAALIGGMVYLFVKVVVLDRKGPRSFQWALATVPFWYGMVAGFEAWLIGWKSPRITQPSVLGRELTDGETAALYFGPFLIVGLLSALFIVPYIRRAIWLGWSGLQFYHLPIMVLPDATVLSILPGADKKSAWFDDRHLRNEEVPASEDWAWTETDMKKIARTRGIAVPVLNVAAKSPAAVDVEEAATKTVTPVATEAAEPEDPVKPSAPAPAPPALSHWGQRKADYVAAMNDKSLPITTKISRSLVFWGLIGVDRDIADHGIQTEEISTLHDNAPKNYGKTERLFMVLQVLTSSIACFAHGANDVGISVGPLSTLYNLWDKKATNPGAGSMSSKSVVTDWQLAVGAVCLVLGLWFYGYNMMRVLGNRLTFHSPSRGFSMELGAAITVLIAARNGIPVSTTNCIVGSTVGVGLASSGYKSVNWKLALKTLGYWIITLPVTGVVSGLLFAFASYAPNIQCKPYTFGPSTPGGKALLNGKNITSSTTIWPAGCMPQ